MAIRRSRTNPRPACCISKSESGRALLGDQFERGPYQGLFQIAVVIATRFGAPAPFHVNGINMSPVCASIRALRATATLGGQGQMVEQCWSTWLRAFDCHQTELADHAARGREPACLAAGSQHAMTRNDQRNRILPEGLPDVAGEQFVAESFRDFPVG